MSWSGGPLARLRRPEYTGANRCGPCTVANLVVAALGCAHLYLWGAIFASPAAGGAAAAVVAVVSVAMVWLRGYLLPGTPTLTRRFPTGLLAVFGKDTTPTVARGVTGCPPTETDGGVAVEPAEVAGTAESDEFDPDAVLDAAGVTASTTGSADGPTDDLSTAFRDAWDGRLSDTTPNGPALVDRFGLPGGTAVARTGRGAVARADGERVGAWPSALALRADLAAAAALADRVPDWGAYAPAERGRLTAALRARCEACPDCGGSLSTGPVTVRSCCGRLDVVATECVDCGARLVEAPTDSGA